MSIDQRLLLSAGMFVLLILTVLIYYPGLHGPFLLDDWHNIRLAVISDLSWNSIEELMKSGGGLPAERPLPFLTFAANLQLFGGGSFPFKAVNLAIHLLIGLALFALAGRIARLYFPDSTPGLWRASAIIASGLWVLHPIHVSTVLYTVQRMAQMSALFTIVALLVYLLLRTALQQRRHRAAAALGVCFFLSAIAALASKQNAVLIPLFILAIEIPALGTASSVTRNGSTRLLAISLAVVPVIAGMVAAVVFHEHLLANYAKRDFTMDERIATELRILWDYVGQILIPRLGEFGIYQDGFSLSNFRSQSTWIALLAWLLTILIATLMRKATPIVLFAVLWFLSAHALESTFIPLELVFEHRNYLAAFGPIFALAVLGVQLPDTRLRGAMLIGLLGLATLLCLQTSARATSWKDYLTLTSTSVLEHPRSSRARSAYALALIKVGRVDDALEQLEIGSRIEPNDAGFPISRLAHACEHDRYSPVLLSEATEAARNRRLTPYALNALNTLHMHVKHGRCAALSAEQLLELYDAALTEVEGRTNTRNHSSLHRLRGLLLANTLNRPEEAYPDFSMALQLYPKWQPPRINLVRTLIRLGRMDEATGLVDEFLADPDHLSPGTLRQLERLRSIASDHPDPGSETSEHTDSQS